MFYIKRVFILVLVFFECNYCHKILACCRVKEFNKPTEEDKGKNPIALFVSNYTARSSKFFYIHDICFRNKGLFYKFFLQQHTTSREYYLCWTIFEHAIKNLTGVVWIYKKEQDFEFYYGSVVGIGWYPREFNFNKYFRVGFFDMSINLIALFMHVCHFFCNLYFDKQAELLFNNFIRCSIRQESGKYNWKIFVPECEKAIKMEPPFDTKKILGYYIEIVKTKSALLCKVLFRNISYGAFSFINIKTAFGIKIKFVRSVQILKFIKFVSCSFCSNISILANGIQKDLQGKVLLIDYPPEDIFIYSYSFESHFFFGERDSIFLLLLELFIPSIEICLNHDNF